MSRFIAIALLCSMSSAWAADTWQSEPRDFKFDQTLPVRGDTVRIPLTVTVIQKIAENIGVVPTLTGNAQLRMYMEGTSQVSWPVPGIEDGGAVMQEITPVPDSAYVNMDAEMGMSIDVVGDIMGSHFSFTVLSQQINFKDKTAKFTPFMLPYQMDSQPFMTLRPQPTNGKFDYPLIIPIFSSGSVLSVGAGIVLHAEPVSRGIVGGDYLDSMVTQPNGDADLFETDGSDQEGDGVFRNVVALYDPLDMLQVANSWEATVTTALGYLVKVDIAFQLQIFGFPLDFQFNLWQQQFDIFPEMDEYVQYDAVSVDPSNAGDGYVLHPMPQIQIRANEVKFQNIAIGESKAFQYAVTNKGRLALEATATLQGDPAFSLSPPQISVDGGGQEAFVITFKPTADKAYQGTLIIDSNDPVNPHLEIPITANGAKRDSGNGGLNGDNGFQTSGDASFYDCGCASASLTPLGLGPLAFVPLIVLVRRRRRQA